MLLPETEGRGVLGSGARSVAAEYGEPVPGNQPRQESNQGSNDVDEQEEQQVEAAADVAGIVRGHDWKELDDEEWQKAAQDDGTQDAQRGPPGGVALPDPDAVREDQAGRENAGAGADAIDDGVHACTVIAWGLPCCLTYRPQFTCFRSARCPYPMSFMVAVPEVPCAHSSSVRLNTRCSASFFSGLRLGIEMWPHSR